MKKHRFNIFPEMGEEDYQRLMDNLKTHGYDSSQPIVIFENEILDGWNRFRACDELGIPYAERSFPGDAVAAINYVIRTNTRRNLSSQQLAAIAVEAEDILREIEEETERERREKQARSLRQTHAEGRFGVSDNKLSETKQGEGESGVSDNKLSETNSGEFEELTYELDEEYRPTQDDHANSAATKLAQTFNTNRTYIQKAKKLKQTDPEKLRQVREGKITFSRIEKETSVDFTEKAEKLFEGRRSLELVIADGQDPFTQLAALQGRKICEAVKALSQEIERARALFADNDQSLESFAKNLDLFNPDILLLDVRRIKHLRICDSCDGGKCEACNRTGYQVNGKTKSAGGSNG